jgi:hypothetical protein
LLLSEFGEGAWGLSGCVSEAQEERLFEAKQGKFSTNSCESHPVSVSSPRTLHVNRHQWTLVWELFQCVGTHARSH